MTSKSAKPEEVAAGDHLGQEASVGSDLFEARWRAWCELRNLRGLRVGLWIGLLGYLTFCVLDYLSAPREALTFIFTIRGLVVALSVAGLFLLDRPFVRRWATLLMPGYAGVLAYGIIFMVVVLGGFRSPYYAGIMLVMISLAVLGVLPLKVSLLAYGGIVAGYVLCNLLLTETDQWVEVVTNLFFLVTTAVIVVIAQQFLWLLHRQQIRGQLELEEARRSESAASQDLELRNRELRSANDQLRELARIKNEFFANISHEFRTPLTLILGGFRTILSPAPQGGAERLREQAQVGLRNASRLLLLINDLLDLSRLDSRRSALHKQRVDLAQLVRQVAANFQSSDWDSGRLQVMAPHQAVVIEADARLLKSVFYNLLNNAVKFSDKAGGCVRVSLAAEETGAVVQISDQGIGIPADQLDRIFERFTQVDGSATRPYSGTGIGLALVKEAVEAHGGQVGVSSELGEGTTFTITLPRGADLAGVAEEPVAAAEALDEVIAAACARTPATAPAVPGGEAARNDLPLVLVVEDHDDLRAYVGSILSTGHRVCYACDGAEALQQVRAEHPDLVVTDMMMPRMSGQELLLAIRQGEGLEDLPILFLTARSEAEARAEAIEAGANDYLAKPFDERELLARVKALLRQRSQQLQLAQTNEQLATTNKALEELALIDQVTQIANRRSFDQAFAQEWQRMLRTREPLALAIGDIDGFKSYNDIYGHQAGDACLRTVADALVRTVRRPADLVARYGGEEYVMLLPATDLAGGQHVAERARLAVSRLRIPHQGSPTGEWVTVSLGVSAVLPTPGTDAHTLLHQADSALYQAKRGGRNCLVVWDPDVHPLSSSGEH